MIHLDMLSASQHLCSLAHGIIHVLLHLLDGCLMNERAAVDTFFEAIADFESLDLGDECLNKLVVHSSVHVDAVLRK